MRPEQCCESTLRRFLGCGRCFVVLPHICFKQIQKPTEKEHKSTSAEKMITEETGERFSVAEKCLVAY